MRNHKKVTIRIYEDEANLEEINGGLVKALFIDAYRGYRNRKMIHVRGGYLSELDRMLDPMTYIDIKTKK